MFYSDQYDFDADFAKLLAEAESKSIKQRKEKQGHSPVHTTSSKENESPSKDPQNAALDAREGKDGGSSNGSGQPEDATTVENGRAAALAK